MTRVAKVLLGIIATLTLAAVILEQGVWTQRVTLDGPFQPEGSPGSRALLFPVKAPLACCLEVRSDSPSRPSQSDLKLWINGQPYGPAHSIHAEIRQGNTIGYSHWSGYVLFAPPAGAQHVSAFVKYAIRPTRLVLWSLAGSAIGLWLVLFRRAATTFVAGPGQAIARSAIAAPYRLAQGAGYVALAAAATFAAVSTFAWSTGWGLPTTALLRWSATARGLAQEEPRLGQFLVVFAAIGSLATWIALIVPGGQPLIARQEARLLRFVRFAGFPIVACSLIFSLSAMWSGTVRPGDQQGSAIGGLVSFSDASGYVSDTYDQARDGTWRPFTLRRPIAGASRSLLYFAAGYSVPRMLALQVLALAAALCFAGVAIARWRGVWPALAFVGLSYTYARSFAPTTLTESLGLTWGLLSIGLLVMALHRDSRRAALWGIGAMTLSLMARMGAMFAIPALIGWVFFRRSEANRIKNTVAVIAVVTAVLATSFSLSKLYGAGQGATGGNFAYTACGLAIGTTWDGCPQVMKQEGQTPPADEAELDRRLYRMAIDNIEAHPGVLINRLMAGVSAFVSELPSVAWRGYFGDVVEPAWLPTAGVFWLGAVGLVLVLFRRRGPGELSFWIWMIAAILISAPFVYFDDGRRVLAASYLLLFVLFAIGFSGPDAEKREQAPIRPLPSPALAVGVVSLALVLGPGLSHLVYAQLEPHPDTAAERANEVWMWGRHVNGFLVVADDAPLVTTVPTLHVSEFESMINASGIERYQGLIHPTTPPLPFAFVDAPRLDGKNSEFKYIAPPEVLERRDVSVWRWSLEDWQRTTEFGPYWFRVTAATAVR